MFKEPTVIILGAGASVEFGLPSGQDVFKAFSDLCVDIRPKLGVGDSTDYILKCVGEFSSFNDRGLLTETGLGFRAQLEILQGLEKTEVAASLVELSKMVSKQPHNSIDEFLYDNPRFYRVGKLFSSYCIGRSLVVGQPSNKIYSKTPSFKLRDGSKLYDGRSWLATLARRLMEGCENSTHLRDNELTIITFNYDTLTEEGLLSLIQNTEKFSDIGDLDFISFLHVNGEFDVFDDSYPMRTLMTIDRVSVPDGPLQVQFNENASNIFMINEEVSEKVQGYREAAKLALTKGKKIYTMGFAFDPNNVSLIGLDKTWTKIPDGTSIKNEDFAEFFALNYNGNIKVQKRIDSIKPYSTAINGSADKPVGCSEAADLGFFEQ